MSAEGAPVASSDGTMALRRLVAASWPRVRDVFAAWDEDGNGQISKSEWTKVLAGLRLSLSAGEAGELFDQGLPGQTLIRTHAPTLTLTLTLTLTEPSRRQRDLTRVGAHELDSQAGLEQGSSQTGEGSVIAARQGCPAIEGTLGRLSCEG